MQINNNTRKKLINLYYVILLFLNYQALVAKCIIKLETQILWRCELVMVISCD